MSRIRSVLSALRAEGHPVAEGSIAIDPRSAREKLETRSLADRQRYVLALVQAAVLYGAKRIDFAIEAEELELRFDGRAVPREDLEDLSDGLLGRAESRESRARRELALGLGTILAHGPEEIRIRTRCNVGTLCVRLRPDEAPEITTEGRLCHETTIVVVGARADAALLAEHARYATVPIKVGKHVVSEGFEVPGAVLTEAIDDGEPGLEGVLALVPEEGDATLALVKDGVTIETRPLAGLVPPTPGLVAVVSSERLRSRAPVRARRFSCSWVRV